jgi:hypothetical protein
LARAASLTPEQRRAIAKKGADARKELASLPKATPRSADRPLKIGDIEIPCYVLPRRSNIADQCEALVRGFARVGIIALVDKATGYQKDRARDALAKAV